MTAEELVEELSKLPKNTAVYIEKDLELYEVTHLTSSIYGDAGDTIELHF